uniref:Uncharacterized protein n=1 Tax=Octopus bimaculoides TaxID=37653 RepID=A0A0L8GTE6_OCTBM
MVAARINTIKHVNVRWKSRTTIAAPSKKKGQSSNGKHCSKTMGHVLLFLLLLLIKVCRRYGNVYSLVCLLVVNMCCYGTVLSVTLFLLVDTGCYGQSCCC